MNQIDAVMAMVYAHNLLSCDFVKLILDGDICLIYIIHIS